uniref:Uncharacterized protein n=1 Tax=Leptomonas pyrrhocoris ostravirus TaxID=3070843 RepID=A0AA50Q9D3_9VIRU|nr:hypothetical protein [Leptomonas pyrrhocoris ostravirus]
MSTGYSELTGVTHNRAVDAAILHSKFANSQKAVAGTTLLCATPYVNTRAVVNVTPANLPSNDVQFSVSPNDTDDELLNAITSAISMQAVNGSSAAKRYSAVTNLSYIADYGAQQFVLAQMHAARAASGIVRLRTIGYGPWEPAMPASPNDAFHSVPFIIPGSVQHTVERGEWIGTFGDNIVWDGIVIRHGTVGKIPKPRIGDVMCFEPIAGLRVMPVRGGVTVAGPAPLDVRALGTSLAQDGTGYRVLACMTGMAPPPVDTALSATPPRVVTVPTATVMTVPLDVASQSVKSRAHEAFTQTKTGLRDEAQRARQTMYPPNNDPERDDDHAKHSCGKGISSRGRDGKGGDQRADKPVRVGDDADYAGAGDDDDSDFADEFEAALRRVHEAREATARSQTMDFIPDGSDHASALAGLRVGARAARRNPVSASSRHATSSSSRNLGDDDSLTCGSASTAVPPQRGIAWPRVTAGVAALPSMGSAVVSKPVVVADDLSQADDITVSAISTPANRSVPNLQSELLARLPIVPSADELPTLPFVAPSATRQRSPKKRASGGNATTASEPLRIKYEVPRNPPCTVNMVMPVTAPLNERMLENRVWLGPPVTSSDSVVSTHDNVSMPPVKDTVHVGAAEASVAHDKYDRHTVPVRVNTTAMNTPKDGDVVSSAATTTPHAQRTHVDVVRATSRATSRHDVARNAVRSGSLRRANSLPTSGRSRLVMQETGTNAANPPLTVANLAASTGVAVQMSVSRSSSAPVPAGFKSGVRRTTSRDVARAQISSSIKP